MCRLLFVIYRHWERSSTGVTYVGYMDRYCFSLGARIFGPMLMVYFVDLDQLRKGNKSASGVLQTHGGFRFIRPPKDRRIKLRDAIKHAGFIMGEPTSVPTSNRGYVLCSAIPGARKCMTLADAYGQ